MRLIYYRHNIRHPVRALPEQIIPYWELTFLFHGEMCYRANGEALRLTDGDLLLLAPGMARSRDSVSGCDYVSFNFIFEAGEAERKEEAELAALPAQIGNGTDPVERALLSATDGVYAETHDMDDEGLKRILSAILLCLRRRVRNTDTSPVVIGVKAYVRSHYAEKFTLASVARHLGYSAGYIEDVFRRETGMPVMAYVISERIRASQLLLSDGVWSLTEVAEKCGFSEPNYFSRAFKKQVGCTPTQYRIRIFP